ncbi:unnamed protein product [Acanthoscelides obtectus]|uniref:Uncharacterized protein n=1 Tax=Acanthoscelides obtectus TaxID=200917 RepID=A0A9P0L0Y3_ACAOB|nr:unnamed protein product [Acanthoscelides obtectus]CAK1623406.1 hypothetical protein AOBTE_LOCUS1987 [Acanthoscelides obtectus]
MLALKWNDKRDVTMLTSMHEALMGVTKNCRDQEVEKSIHCSNKFTFHIQNEDWKRPTGFSKGFSKTNYTKI